MTESEYNSTIRDLTNFMVYLAEPAKLVRYRIGFWVMIFMVVFIVLSYTLKKEYWRDVHLIRCDAPVDFPPRSRGATMRPR
jgi:ubiquinol-cytochrome c reductase cytochrome c1 subunit